LHTGFDGKPDGKRPLLRLRHRLKDDIKMDFSRSGIGRYGLGARAQDRARWRVLLNAVMNLRVPLKCGEFID
jgi:hypothetical protein